MIPCDSVKASFPDMCAVCKKVVVMLIVILGILATLILIGVRRSDPYSAKSRIRAPFTTQLNADGQLSLQQVFVPQLKTGRLAQLAALLKTGLRIPLYSLVLKETPLRGSEAEIIAAIHTERFNPDKPYVITGSHYSDLYMRNMGVFFNALLDPRLPTTDADWQNRQRLALQTIAYDLAFLKANQGVAVTTIAPVENGFVGLNIYRPPSDSLWAVLYSLKALSDPEFVVTQFPVATDSATATVKPLQTKAAAQKLLDENRDVLTTALNHYLNTTIDPETQLIRRDIHLSSARDGIKRESSFYDNVITWATVRLADELRIPHSPTLDSQAWRQKILETYWDEQAGIFRNDLAAEETFFSADSLIVTSSGFFDVADEADRAKLARIIAYIQAQKLDQPFPLKYSRTNQSNNMHPTVKFFAPSYMGDGIWSHWGMEYIKALLMLADSGNEGNDYALQAEQHLETYRQNIEKFGGYPELYTSTGELFRSSLVHGVLHTGWVVNYEQAKVMRGN